MKTFFALFGWCLSALAFSLVSHAAHIDTSFDPGIGPNQGGAVLAVEPLQDGRVLVGGEFTSWNGTAQRGLVRLNADGSLDQTFNFGVNAPVSRIFLQGDRLWVQAGSALVKINPDGSRDTNVPPFTASGIAVPSGDNIYRTWFPARSRPVVELYTITGQFVRQLMEGSVGEQVHVMEPLANGGMLLGGRFVRPNIVVDGQVSPGTQNLAAFTPEGLDLSFVSDAPPGVRLIALGSDGTLYVAADVPSSAGLVVTRLFSSGRTDSNFVARPTAILAMTVQPDGRLVFGAQDVTRLNLDGSVDHTFVPVFNNATIEALSVQSDGRILVGGTFNTVDGEPRRNIARLLPEAVSPPSPPPPVPPPDGTLFVISGRVTDGTNGVPGVRVKLRKRVTFTDENGAYQFTEVQAGRYVVKAKLRRTRIRPAAQRVTVTEDVSGVDFLAVQRGGRRR